MSEQTMTADQVLNVIGDCVDVLVKHDKPYHADLLNHARAAVAELVSDKAQLQYALEQSEQAFIALRRRVEGLKTAIRGAQIDLDAGETAIAARRITAALKELT